MLMFNELLVPDSPESPRSSTPEQESDQDVTDAESVATVGVASCSVGSLNSSRNMESDGSINDSSSDDDEPQQQQPLAHPDVLPASYRQVTYSSAEDVVLISDSDDEVSAALAAADAFMAVTTSED